METEETKNEIALISESSNIIEQANQLVIKNQQDMEAAINVSKTIRETIKAAEEERKSLVKPLNDHVSMINNRYKTRITDILTKAKSLLDQKMLAWQRAENERVRLEIEAENNRRRIQLEEEFRKLEEEKNRKAELLAKHGFKLLAKETEQEKPVEIEIIETKFEEVKTTRAESGASFIVRTTKDFRLLDFSKVPNEYKILDLQKIKKVAAAGIKEIPGMELIEIKTPQLR